MADAADFDRQMAAQNARGGKKSYGTKFPTKTFWWKVWAFLQRKGDGTASPNLFPVCCRPSGRR